MTKEERFARKLAEVVSHRDFSPEVFAKYLMEQDPYVQAFVVRTGLNITEFVAELTKRGFSHPEYGLANWLAKELKYLED